MSSSGPSRSAQRPGQTPNRMPACDRCRNLKKRCSRTFPACNLCSHANQDCSYSATPISPEAEVLQLRARVQWLSAYIDHHALQTDTGRSVADIATGSDLDAILKTQQQREVSNSGTSKSRARIQAPSAASPVILEPPPTSVATEPFTVGESPVSFGLDETSRNGPSSAKTNLPSQNVGSTDLAARPSHEEVVADANDGMENSLLDQRSPSEGNSTMRYVQAYFRNVDRAYPFLYQSKIVENLGTLGGLAQGLRDSQSTLLYLIMSIGCTTLEHGGKFPKRRNMHRELAYGEIIQECVCQPGIESIQILTLLALYSLFDPSGPSAYSIVGMSARQAIALGLASRTSDMQNDKPRERELRHRLYWSIFALDRMMAVSQGLPMALPDNADVPLPALTVEEFASAEREDCAWKLQTSRHVILLRQLEGHILEKVHFRKAGEVAELSPSDRRATLSRLRGMIEDWYSQGCLMSPMRSDSATVHRSTTWLSARYYFLLVLLYYPNHFNSRAKAASRLDLLHFAKCQLQASSALFHQQQLPLNRNTLFRLMPVCLMLLHSGMMTPWAAEPTTPGSELPVDAREAINMALAILEAFPETWQAAHSTARIMHQFIRLVPGNQSISFADDVTAQFGPCGPTAGCLMNTAITGEGSMQTKEDQIMTIRSCVSSLTAVIQDMLGPSTCFQHVECADASQAEFSTSTMILPAQQPLPPLRERSLQEQQLLFPPARVTNDSQNPPQVNQDNSLNVDDELTEYAWGLDMALL